MSKRTRRFGTGYVEHKTGREGPRHDPYGYDEWTVHGTLGHKKIDAKLHMGLMCWADINGQHVEERIEDDAHTVHEFEKAIGMSLRDLERAMDRIPRCCDKMSPIGMAGYPGEHFTVCASCGKHLDYYFNESAII